ncbi:50S ribosomal protein L32 [candidate division WWE3 bacterium CG08_land_8_20_14_0_20_41_15]|uniref:Large ribosomal subunit protein bL32 n=1 Tax=candidate division WWE3 bacterium CG08_land_8_20_14_0_20_41_15 TaxID=1975086 RepID=A0A2H0X933_UNCKA|nr:MAG: 50S ribosomal protein L32 [candidate division WWE3 bacterium CG08_land_8_20_14_0_20_41_15]
MGALPKRRISKGRRDRRRLKSKLVPVLTVKCQKCGKEKLPHRVCKNCGTK